MHRDSIQAYLNEIGRHPLLTKSQEILLGTQIQASIAVQQKDPASYTKGDVAVIRLGERAKTKFINCNLRLVINIARKYTRQCRTLELMDLIQEGNIGLVRAIEKFDPTRGYAFSTYAYWWIRQSIQRSIQTTDSCIRLPIAIHESMHKITKATEALSKELGRNPTLCEIAKKIGIKPEEMRSVISTPKSFVSLDKAVGEQDTGAKISDVIQDPKSSNSVEDAENRMNIADIYTVIDNYIDEQAKFVILERSKTPPTAWIELSRITKMSKAKLQAIEQEGLKRCALLIALKNKI